ncbi:MAG: hypothetical protein AAF367_20860 [Pseudomonadota bacterium]
MLRFLSYLFLLTGLGALAFDVWRGPFKEAPLEFTSTSQYWTQFDAASLASAKGFIETSVSPDLWALAIQPAISWPAFVLFLLLGLIIMALSGRGQKNIGREGLMFPKGRR